ncbi:Sucrase-isomaltase intestinal, partial [Fusarium beomiforme]
MLKENLLGSQRCFDPIICRQKAILHSRPKSILPVWDLTQSEKVSDSSKVEDLDFSFTQGFFNGIPSGTVVLNATGNEHSYGLVSTAWQEWKTYVLHPVPSEVLTEAKVSNIAPSNILGYTMGSWTTQDLSQQAAGIRLLVVEAELRLHRQRVNFAMNACLYPGNSKILSSYEQRIFCGRLNPTLFRYAPPRRDNLIDYHKPSKRLKRKREPDFQFLYTSPSNQPSQDAGFTDSPTEPYSSDEFWDEMMAREVWDRIIEKQRKVEAPDPRAE